MSRLRAVSLFSYAFYNVRRSGKAWRIGNRGRIREKRRLHLTINLHNFRLQVGSDRKKDDCSNLDKAETLEKRRRKTRRYLLGIITSNEDYGNCRSKLSGRRSCSKCRYRVICVWVITGCNVRDALAGSRITQTPQSSLHLLSSHLLIHLNLWKGTLMRNRRGKKIEQADESLGEGKGL